MKISLADYWRRAAADLEIEVTVPFELVLADETRLHADALVRDFGADRGMLIVSSSAEVSRHRKELERLGFGFSTMADPTDDYGRWDCIAVLRDWGWTGNLTGSPIWL